VNKARTKVGNRQQILDYINSNKNRLRTEYHVRKIALIGSFAREEQTPESDVDLLLDLEPDTQDIHMMKRRLRMELETEFGRSVELASERYLKPYYKEEILREAIYV
jgi:predicted nucleotidyltransferase